MLEREEPDEEFGDKPSEGPLVETAEAIERSKGRDRGKFFYDVAMGAATPLDSLIDPWLQEVDMKPRQQMGYRKAVMKFTLWLTSEKLPVSVEVCNRKIAGRYVMDNRDRAAENMWFWDVMKAKRLAREWLNKRNKAK